MPYYPPPVTVPAAAVAADQETATSTTTYVNPGVQQRHPSACKGWIQFDGTGTISITGSYNVSGITDGGTGTYTVTWDTDFSGATYACVASSGGSETKVGTSGSLMAGSVGVIVQNSSGTAIDSATVCVVAFGDQ